MHRPRFLLVESNTTGTGRLFIQSARALGFEPVLLTQDPSRYPFVAAESLRVVRAATNDRVALLRLVQSLVDTEPLAGVWSSSDHYIAQSAWLAVQLGLPGPEFDSLASYRDKGRQRERLHDRGISVPVHQVVTPTSPRVDLDRLELPVVVKPAVGSGSVGVRRCDSASEVTMAVHQLLTRAVTERGDPLEERVVVEAFVSGQEYSIELFNGEAVAATRKHVTPPPWFVELGHDVPAQLPDHVRTSLQGAAIAAAEALQCRWGPCHVEAKFGEGGPVIIEVNMRLAGGFIPELVRLAEGRDLIEETVRAATGLPSTTRMPHQRSFASIRFVLAPDVGGVFYGLLGAEEARAIPGVTDVQSYVTVGRRLQRHGDFRDRIAHVIACQPSAPEVIKTVEDAHRLLEPVVQAPAPLS